MSDRVTSGRELARRLGISHTAIQKAARVGRITRDLDGAWDVARVRRDMEATALPGRSPLARPGDETPVGRLMLARLALKVEGQRLALDRAKGKLMDASTADARIDAIASAMRDAVLNWPARVAGTIAADIRADPHLVQTLLQEHMHALLADVAARLDPPPAA
jgi:alkylation response protein AidB-like acyl-CoA dehydrogenase